MEILEELELLKEEVEKYKVMLGLSNTHMTVETYCKRELEMDITPAQIGLVVRYLRQSGLEDAGKINKDGRLVSVWAKEILDNNSEAIIDIIRVDPILEQLD
jgi:hypothetical protein